MSCVAFVDAGLILLNETFIFLKQQNFFKSNTKYDVTLVLTVGGNEPGYYVAQRFNSSLVLYFAQQMALLNQDYAMGQPHNPAIIPCFGMTAS